MINSFIAAQGQDQRGRQEEGSRQVPANSVMAGRKPVGRQGGVRAPPEGAGVHLQSDHHQALPSKLVEGVLEFLLLLAGRAALKKIRAERKATQL